MRKIEYIFIDSDCQTNDGKSRHHALPNFGYHFVINSQGLVLSPTSIDIPAKLITGPIYDRDKYNKCSICIRYCGTLRPEGLEQREQSRTCSSYAESRQGSTECQTWLIDPNTSCKPVMQQRAALLNLLVQLRGLYPSAKILGVSELDGKELYSKNIIVSDTMNVLREELSNMP